MNCFFCQKILPKEDYDSTVSDDALYSYVCDEHPYKVVNRIYNKLQENQSNFAYFSYVINQSIYVLYYYLQYNTFELICFPTAAQTYKTVINLDFHPDITPENVAEKLPIYIVFS